MPALGSLGPLGSICTKRLMWFSGGGGPRAVGGAAGGAGGGDDDDVDSLVFSHRWLIPSL